MHSDVIEEVQGKAASPQNRLWARGMGLSRAGAEIASVALTLMPDTELTSKSGSNWEAAGSGNSHQKLFNILSTGWAKTYFTFWRMQVGNDKEH